jgi:hypothetical protein
LRTGVVRISIFQSQSERRSKIGEKQSTPGGIGYNTNISPARRHGSFFFRPCRTGTRFVEAKNGSLSALPSESADDDGKWAVLDERTVDCASPGMLHLVAAHSALAPFLRMTKVGVPAAQVERRLRSEAAFLASGVPEPDVARFLALVAAAPIHGGGGTNSNSAAADAHAEAIAEAAARAVGSTLQGSRTERHGRCGQPSWAGPSLVVYHDAHSRPGYTSAKGHEFLDDSTVLRQKVKLLAVMFRRAKKPVVYAGAGLSTASGIGDYATQTGQAGVLATRGLAAGAAAAGVSPFCAKPNRGHR